MSHPKVVSGPYTLADFDGKTAVFERNSHYKGNEEGRKPLLEKLTFTQADQSRMIQDLGEGSLGLVNKVSRQDLIREGYAREVIGYSRGQGRLMCSLRGYAPCRDQEKVRSISR